jgi:hypothetical protein
MEARVKHMNRHHELKLNKLGEIVVSLLDDALMPEQEQHNSQDLLEINRLRNYLKKIAQYGNHGNAALHKWTVPSFTDGNVEYTVKQLLNGTWSCTCPQHRYRGGECKHITKAFVNPEISSALDISYGYGAQEAHRRLTEIAKEGLVG